MSLSLLSVMHVNVNCSDLDRSLRFYRDLVGLTPQTHTEPAPQDGEGFGLPGRVRWDAHLLHDDRGFGGPAIDLLEWKQPKPVGRPAPECNHLGFMRVCFAHRDLDALHARLVAAGVPTRSGPVSVPVVDGSPDVRFFCCADPDGTCVEFVEAPIDGTRLSHININCSDLDASSDWYQRVLGVTTVAPRAEPPPPPARASASRATAATARTSWPSAAGPMPTSSTCSSGSSPRRSGGRSPRPTISAPSAWPSWWTTRKRAVPSSTAWASRTRVRAGSRWAPTCRSRAD